MKYGELQTIATTVSNLLGLIQFAKNTWRVNGSISDEFPHKRPFKRLTHFKRFLRILSSMPHEETVSTLHRAMLKRHMIRCLDKLCHGYDIPHSVDLIDILGDQGVCDSVEDKLEFLSMHGVLNAVQVNWITNLVILVSIRDKNVRFDDGIFASDIDMDDATITNKLNIVTRELAAIEFWFARFMDQYYEVMRRTGDIDIKSLHPRLDDPALI